MLAAVVLIAFMGSPDGAPHTLMVRNLEVVEHGGWAVVKFRELGHDERTGMVEVFSNGNILPGQVVCLQAQRFQGAWMMSWVEQVAPDAAKEIRWTSFPTADRDFQNPVDLGTLRQAIVSLLNRG